MPKPDRDEAQLVFCVLPIGGEYDSTVHVFSSKERAEAWMATLNDTPCVVYDYLVDHPERMTRAAV